MRSGGVGENYKAAEKAATVKYVLCTLLFRGKEEYEKWQLNQPYRGIIIYSKTLRR